MEIGWSDYVAKLDQLVTARKWDEVATPKDLAMALSSECGEVTEIFQWVSSDISQAQDWQQDHRREVSLELADVLNYVVRLASVMHIDLLRAADEKLGIVAAKYPVDEARAAVEEHKLYMASLRSRR